MFAFKLLPNELVVTMVIQKIVKLRKPATKMT